MVVLLFSFFVDLPLWNSILAYTLLFYYSPKAEVLLVYWGAAEVIHGQTATSCFGPLAPVVSKQSFNIAKPKWWSGTGVHPHPQVKTRGGEQAAPAGRDNLLPLDIFSVKLSLCSGS